MISRLVLAIAAVTASVGLLIFGMGSSYAPKRHGMEHWGLGMLIGGAIGILIGIIWYRQTEAVLEAELVQKHGPNGD
jgi:lipoprotein signal peptidase